ncbi:MAG: S-layer homology domain-containing protein, partial [Elusimicrobia bacterium]|nr:S-layer homology domain-containing protein [Elusimicrobiota bacterium]
AIKARVLRLLSFPDVPVDYWARKQIAVIATLGVIKGYPDGNFKPEGNITRAEMATLLSRATGSKGVQRTSKFKDVKNHWAEKFINVAVDKGWVNGYPGNIFKPQANITRAEGIAMIARFAEIKKKPYTNEFYDLASNHWVADLVAGAQAEGFLKYLEGKPFESSKKLTRAEVAEILYQTGFIKKLTGDLFDFDKGY